MLSVNVPGLGYDAIGPGLAALELPLSVRFDPVLRLEDAMPPLPVGPEQLSASVLLSYRRMTPAANAEVWDQAAGRWAPDAEVRPDGEPLIFQAEEAMPWWGLVVAGGAEDAAGHPRFATAVGGFPHYWFRGRFETDDGETYEEVVSAASDVVAFGSVTDRNRIVLGAGDGEKPESATQARLQLKDPGLSVIGGLVVRRSGSSAEVTLSNAAGASVVLLADGGIELRPAAGREVVVDGTLRTGALWFVPEGSTIPKRAS
jgi:hypothetical protein